MYDHQINPQAIVKPNSFIGLMTLYESNYLKLFDLVPNFRDLEGTYIANTPNENDILFTINEKTKHTISFSMSYIFEDSLGIEFEPNMKVNVYLDGRLAQVSGINEDQNNSIFNKIAHSHGDIINLLWRNNMIFNKWLEHIGDKEYYFS
ncbi:MAG: hypothetical protein ACI8XI_000893 [Woeseiaceae bacterium]|jgi:uncharacterized protein YqiB (DUF1249 family)|tara:strand:+ start:22231 stop:22677 length:447 start_codon:yes stop_codon:yes gene_type:complete